MCFLDFLKKLRYFFAMKNVKKNVRIAISIFCAERGMIRMEKQENRRILS